jgi:two-component system NarL family sensor kinase
MATELTAAAVPSARPGWVVFGDGATGAVPRPASPSVGRVVRRFVLANLVAVVLLLAGGLWAGVEAAEDEALADARRITELLAAVLVQPLVDERLLAGDPEAVAAVDAALRGRLVETSVLRLKIWTADGRVVYSDEARLIGLTYPLDDAGQQTLRDGMTRAAVSDLSRPENRFERSAGRLLEVYGLIEGPGGEPLLLETYSVYEETTERRFEIWAQFAPISMVVLLTLVAVQLPLAWRMATQLRATQQERELLQARALDASTEERRLIAGSLHDGIVQDVSASALLVARAADDLRAGPGDGRQQRVAEVLGQAAGALRESVGTLRSLLVEIHPPPWSGPGCPRPWPT